MKQIFYMLSLMLLFSCNTQKESARTGSTSITRPQMVIYKTKQDYASKLHIQMNARKTKIKGFPAPSDLKLGSELRVPVKLNKGYYFDRRGISASSVFIDMDYKTYAGQNKAPSVETLKKLIIDKDPFVEMYACPNVSYRTSKEELNKIVESNFSGCTRIKLKH